VLDFDELDHATASFTLDDNIGQAEAGPGPQTQVNQLLACVADHVQHLFGQGEVNPFDDDYDLL
jgi:hypothetical protein